MICAISLDDKAGFHRSGRRAKLLLRLLSERFGGRAFIIARLCVIGLVLMPRLGAGTRVLVAMRLCVRLGVRLRCRLVARTVMMARAAVDDAGFAPRRV